MSAGMESEVRVAIAARDEQPIIANLFQLYVHDFSEHWRDRAEGELGPDGRFAPYPWLDDYWREAGRIPLLLRRDERLAGFALLNRASHTGAPIDHNMAEFFVARKHRRGRVGTAAARMIFEQYPGMWEVAVARANISALAFWRATIIGCASARNVELRDLAGETWDGPLFRFRTG
jgi:predicted acetyltransferase